MSEDTIGAVQYSSTPFKGPDAAALKAALISSTLAGFFKFATRSVMEPVGTGTRSEVPSRRPFISVITRLVARAAPVLVGTMLIAAAVVKHQQEEPDEPITVVKKEEGALTRRVDTWVSRVESFIYGSTDVDTDEYQVNQAKIAVSKGGLLGVGPGNSTTRDFLPQAYNDFIYAIIIEEYGLLGGGFIVFVYLVFLYRCIRIFKRCPFAFGAFLALGLSFTLVIQALANMAVTVNLFPVTGVTLPLVSMGGSSFIFTCLAIGIILSVARNVEQLEGKDKEGDAKAVAA